MICGQNNKRLFELFYYSLQSTWIFSFSLFLPSFPPSYASPCLTDKTRTTRNRNRALLLLFLQALSPLEKGLAGAFLEAAIPEEFFKFICLYFVIWKSKEFDEYLDGIIYAAFVGMGFATVENIFYVLDNGIGNAIFRAFTAVPGHFFDGVIMGYFFALAKFDKQHRLSNLWKSFFFAMLAHGIYDGLIEVSVGFFEEDSDTLMLIGFALVIAFFIFNIKVWKYGIRKIKELAAKDKSSPNALS